jgi:hypothetical protein
VVADNGSLRLTHDPAITHKSPLNLANIVLKNLKSHVIRYIEFISLL